MASDYSPPRLVKPTPGGNPGDGSLDGALTAQASTSGLTNVSLILAGLAAEKILYFNTSGEVTLDNPLTGNLELSPTANVAVANRFVSYASQSLFGYGFSPIYGLDNRTGLTAVDGAPITLYTTTASGQLYRLSGRVLATAGTSPAASYVIKWTEGGAVITKTLTIAALSTDADLMIPIQPDNGTQITAQLTAISGTGTTVNVAAVVEQIA